MAKPTNANVDNEEYLPDGNLVIPNEVAPSGHGGSGPAPVPHPLTPEANKPEAAGEVSNPDNQEIVVGDGNKDEDN